MTSLLKIRIQLLEDLLDKKINNFCLKKNSRNPI